MEDVRREGAQERLIYRVGEGGGGGWRLYFPRADSYVVCFLFLCPNSEACPRDNLSASNQPSITDSRREKNLEE